MRARHARQIRAGIVRARWVQEMYDAINLNPSTLAAFVLATVVRRYTSDPGSSTALENRAYLRTRLRARRRPGVGGGKP